MIIAKAGLLNTMLGYILPMIVSPFNIFLFRQVFVGLPDDVYEAAQLDHCGPVKYFFTMVLPMSKSVVATVSVFTFLGVWNDYLWPLLMLTDKTKMTLPIALSTLNGQFATEYNVLMAGSLISMIPIILIYCFAQKYFQNGMMAGGIKG